MKDRKTKYVKKLGDIVNIFFFSGKDVKELESEPFKSLIVYNHRVNVKSVKVPEKNVTIGGSEYIFPLPRKNSMLLRTIINKLTDEQKKELGVSWIPNSDAYHKLSAIVERDYKIDTVQVDSEDGIDIRLPEGKNQYAILITYKKMILAYTKGTVKPGNVYIEWVNTSPLYRGYSLCPMIIQETINRNRPGIGYELQNAGGVGSCYCYIKTFVKNGYVAVIDKKSRKTDFCHKANIDGIFNFIQP